jgi:hypothetical protein
MSSSNVARSRLPEPQQLSDAQLQDRTLTATASIDWDSQSRPLRIPIADLASLTIPIVDGQIGRCRMAGLIRVGLLAEGAAGPDRPGADYRRAPPVTGASWSCG